MRWIAVVTYRSDTGPVDVTHDLDELSDLHQLVEAGPHFDTIINISISRINHCDDENLTIESAEKL